MITPDLLPQPQGTPSGYNLTKQIGRHKFALRSFESYALSDFWGQL